jgi:hypothetical protein
MAPGEGCDGVDGAVDRSRMVSVVKAVHTAIWFSVEAAVLYLLYAGVRKRTDASVTVAAALVAGETAVFLLNGARCPLTEVANRLGASDGSVTDIYLPRWFAHYLPVIHVPVIAAIIFLHRGRLVSLCGGLRP